MKLEFSLEEYKNRHARTVDLLEKNNLDALLVTAEPNVNYYSGFRNFIPWWTYSRPYILVIPKEKDPILLVQGFHRFDAAHDSWIKDVRGYPGLTRTPVPLVVDIFKELNLLGKRIGMELGYEQRMFMPYRDVVNLMDELHGCELVDASEMIWKQRMIKSDAEVAAHRLACQIGDKAYRACFSATHEGMTEVEVGRILNRTIIEEGGEPGFLIICSGTGNYGRVAGMPTGRKLMKGDLMWIDLGVIANGYWCDFCRAGVVGGPTSEQNLLQEAVVEITRKTIESIRPGMKASELARVCGKAASDIGISFSFEAGRLGHGMGIMSTEPPHIAVYDDTILEPGMVFTVEPGVVNDIGTFIAEENLIVTTDGCEYLTSTSQELRSL
jgi:Xaa-Pro aminopeptidase